MKDGTFCSPRAYAVPEDGGRRWDLCEEALLARFTDGKKVSADSKQLCYCLCGTTMCNTELFSYAAPLYVTLCS